MSQTLSTALFKAQKGTAEYEEWLRKYREKRSKLKVDNIDSKKEKSKIAATTLLVKSYLSKQGIKVPSSFESKHDKLEYTSHSDRAIRYLEGLRRDLESKGWRQQKPVFDSNPDGSNSSQTYVFVSPDHKFVHQQSLNYGSFYSAYFSTAKDEQIRRVIHTAKTTLDKDLPFQFYEVSEKDVESNLFKVPCYNRSFYEQQLVKRGFEKHENTYTSDKYKVIFEDKYALVKPVNRFNKQELED